MSAPTTEQIKELRERTGAGMLDCKKALIENNLNTEKAVDFLREKGLAKAAKRSGKETREGKVVAYIHGNGKVGVLLELNCETDFVAGNEAFEALGKDLCLQVAALSPQYINSEEIPAEEIEREKSIMKSQLLEEGKKEEQIDKILPGKLKKYFSEICLLDQAFIKDNTRTISQVIQETAAKFGENITVGKFSRFQVGG